MQIAGILQSQSLNFGSKVRIPMKDGTTTVLNVVSKPHSYKVTEISGDVMSKGKSVKKIMYKNKNGFSDERFTVIMETLCKDASDPEAASFKIMNNLAMKKIDYDA